MIDSSAKSSRLEIIRIRLSQKPEGYTSAELGEILGVPPRTVLRDIETLQSSPHYLPIEKMGKKYRILPGYKPVITPVLFNAEEAAVVFIAARLLSQHSGALTSVAHSALLKLSKALPAEVGNYLLKSLTNLQALANLQNEKSQTTVTNFANLVTAWVTRRKVTCEHKTLKGTPKKYTLAPYTFEPSAVGYAIYVRGQCDEDPPGRLRTLKLERVKSTTLTNLPFELPAMEAGQLSTKTWHIWDNEQPPLKVHLRFKKVVVARLKETIWQTGQELVDLPNGNCDWLAEVAEPKEMLPWIRGWGADCEVIAPQELRNALILETRHLAKLYHIKQYHAETIPKDQTELFKQFGEKFFGG